MIAPNDRWGLYQWFQEHGTDLVHPDELEAFRRLLPSGKVFECIGRESDYLVLTYGERRFHVKPALFKPVPAPAKKIGDRVCIRRKGDIVPAVVTDVIWHFQRSEPFYFVAAASRKLSKRYWQSDFVTE